MIRARCLGALVTAAIAVLLVASPAALAAPAPTLRIESLSNTTVAPGGTIEYQLELRNTGDAPTLAPADPTCDPTIHDVDPNCLTFEAVVPAGITATAVKTGNFGAANNFHTSACTGLDEPGPALVSCSTSSVIRVPAEEGPNSYRTFVLEAIVAPTGAPTTIEGEFHVSGGGSVPTFTVDPTTITDAQPVFDFDALDGQVIADPSGSPYTQAAGHPFAASVSVDFATTHNSNPFKGNVWPVAPVKDVFTELPPGLVGNPTAAGTCTTPQLADPNGEEHCSPSSQVGTITIRLNGLGSHNSLGPVPLFNMAHPPGVPARFGFNVSGTVVALNAKLRSGGDYGIAVDGADISEGLPIAGATVTIWGIPADPVHTPERGCPGKFPPFGSGVTCPPETSPVPFLRQPTSCTAPSTGLPTSVRIDSWFDPGARDSEGEPQSGDPNWQSRTFNSHRPLGYLPGQWGEEVGTTGCESVPFTPSLEVEPGTEEADSPSGLGVDLRIPQSCWLPGEASSICQSDLRDATVTLPAGMTVNPSSAGGQQACSPAQVGLKSQPGQPPRFSGLPANCPDGAKIGTAEINTPLLDHPVEGSVYLASQGQNPFGSLLAIYMVFEDPQSGTIIKQAGHVVPGPTAI